MLLKEPKLTLLGENLKYYQEVFCSLSISPLFLRILAIICCCQGYGRLIPWWRTINVLIGWSELKSKTFAFFMGTLTNRFQNLRKKFTVNRIFFSFLPNQLGKIGLSWTCHSRNQLTMAVWKKRRYHTWWLNIGMQILNKFGHIFEIFYLSWYLIKWKIVLFILSYEAKHSGLIVNINLSG